MAMEVIVEATGCRPWSERVLCAIHAWRRSTTLVRHRWPSPTVARHGVADDIAGRQCGSRVPGRSLEASGTQMVPPPGRGFGCSGRSVAGDQEVLRSGVASWPQHCQTRFADARTQRRCARDEG